MTVDTLPASTETTEAVIVWQPADKLVLRLTGALSLDAGDAEDRAMFESLIAGQEVELRISATLSKASLEWVRNRSGDIEGTVATKHAAIESAWPSE